MNILQAAQAALYAAAPLILAYAVRALGAYLAARARGEQTRRALALAADAVQASVAQTAQTCVDALKGTPSWDAHAHKRAFEQAKAQVENSLGKDVKNILTEELGDFDAWLTAKIEQYVRLDRNQGIGDKGQNALISGA